MSLDQIAAELVSLIGSPTRSNQLANELLAIAWQLKTENDRLRTRVLSAAGDDLCRLTQEEIKQYTSGEVQIPPKEEFIASCERFHQQIADGAGVLPGCATLAQMIAENEQLRARQITPRIINEKRRGSAVIVYHEGYVLTCLRIACRDMNGFWQIPGGAVEFHETIYEAAIREFYEETGGRIEAPDYICDAVAEMPEQEPFWTSFFIHVPRARFEAFNTEPQRHGDWEWVKIEELLQRKLLPSIGLVLQSEQFKRLITPIPRLNNAQGSDE